MKPPAIPMTTDVMVLAKETPTNDSETITQDVKAKSYQPESNTDSSTL